MHHAANSIFDKAQIGGLTCKVYLSETDAEVIDPTGYTVINITQAGAAETRTLGNGAEGQMLWMICTAYAADVVVTPAALVGTTITFNADEDVWCGIFLKGEWHTLYVYGSTAVA
jgi:hypothetical protein